MQSVSRLPGSNQSHLHPKLAATVRRHLGAVPRKPAAAHNIAAFEQLLAALAARPRPLLLDSFCGTGHSTALLARQHPGHFVVGIDKSAHRLARHPQDPAGQYLLLQAECEDLWRLLAEQDIGVRPPLPALPQPLAQGQTPATQGAWQRRLLLVAATGCRRPARGVRTRQY